ncbi:MAG: hypothetical protein ACLPKB_07355 [Xanthobacteraceae bacterium]
MVTIELTRDELDALWAACFALHDRERRMVNGTATYEAVKRQDATESLDRIEAVVRKLNPVLHGYGETELKELLDR